MEFNIGNGTLFLPPLHITIIAILIFILLYRWSKQLETRRYTIYLYFLISTYIAVIYSHSTKDAVFELWIPFGFIVVFLHLFRSKSYHSAKMKASVLGLCVAIYRLILQYMS